MIEIHRKEKGQFWVRYIAENGKILATSEMLNTKQSAKKNILATAGVFRIDSKEAIKVTDCTLR